MAEVPAGNVTELSDARRRFEAWLDSVIDGEAAEPGPDDPDGIAEAQGDLAVVFSELGANAVLAGPAGTRIGFQAMLVGRDFRLEVRNQVDSRAASALRWNLDDRLRIGGRGLLLVRAFTDSVDVSTAGDEVRVSVLRHIGRPG